MSVNTTQIKRPLTFGELFAVRRAIDNACDGPHADVAARYGDDSQLRLHGMLDIWLNKGRGRCQALKKSSSARGTQLVARAGDVYWLRRRAESAVSFGDLRPFP